MAADVVSDRKQRLRTLEGQIRAGYEGFVQVGFALKEIRDDELYREEGYVTWDAYLKQRVALDFGLEQGHAHKLIACAQIRTKLPNISSAAAEEGWTQKATYEFGRLAPKSDTHAQRYDFDRLKKKDVERVAKRVIAHCQEQGAKLTAPVVRKFVDEELGIDRTAKGQESKRQRQEQDEERQRLQDDGASIERRLEDLIWEVKKYTDGLRELIAEIGVEEWKRWKASNRVLVERLTTACGAFTGVLMED